MPLRAGVTARAEGRTDARSDGAVTRRGGLRPLRPRISSPAAVARIEGDPLSPESQAPHASPVQAPRADSRRRTRSPGPAVMVREVHTPAEAAVAARLWREYGAWLARHREVTAFDDEVLRRGMARLRAEAAELPGPYAPPSGALLLVLAGDQPVGCGALRRVDRSTAELKRVFVRPSTRGLGAGRALTLALLERARELGYARVVLDTLPGMTAAIALYRALGFRDTAPYWKPPYPGALFLEYRLRRARARRPPGRPSRPAPPRRAANRRDPRRRRTPPLGRHPILGRGASHARRRRGRARPAGRRAGPAAARRGDRRAASDPPGGLRDRR